MSEIKLEVGQVWIDPQGNKADILGIECSDGIIRNIAMQSRTTNKLAMGEFHELIKDHTLITNPDGTPYVKPNDYQAGDVWAFYGTSITPGSAYLIISGRNGLMVLCDYKKDATPMEEMSLIANPINYKLIHRIGVIL